MSLFWTSPNYWDIISNRYGWRWCSKSPKRDIYQPLTRLNSWNEDDPPTSSPRWLTKTDLWNIRATCHLIVQNAHKFHLQLALGSSKHQMSYQCVLLTCFPITCRFSQFETTPHWVLICVSINNRALKPQMWDVWKNTFKSLEMLGCSMSYNWLHSSHRLKSTTPQEYSNVPHY